MLPKSLFGPGQTIRFSDSTRFLERNSRRYPHLDPDFILQICFEHPQRFRDLFPLFDVAIHSARRTTRTIQWVYDNVRYDQSEEPTFWYEQFDSFRESDERTYTVFSHMIREGTWPFPPVIIEADFAYSLGASREIGRPFYLIEGTHRVSYARRMFELGLVMGTRLVELIEVESITPA